MKVFMKCVEYFVGIIALIIITTSVVSVMYFSVMAATNCQ